MNPQAASDSARIRAFSSLSGRELLGPAMAGICCSSSRSSRHPFLCRPQPLCAPGTVLSPDRRHVGAAVPLPDLERPPRDRAHRARHTLASMLLSALAGTACGLSSFVLGMDIYGESPDNWCISIRNYLHFEEMRGLCPPLGALRPLLRCPPSSSTPLARRYSFVASFSSPSLAASIRPFATVVNSVLFGFLNLSLHGLWHMQRASISVSRQPLWLSFSWHVLGSWSLLCRSLGIAMALGGSPCRIESHRSRSFCLPLFP